MNSKRNGQNARQIFHGLSIRDYAHFISRIIFGLEHVPTS